MESILLYREDKIDTMEMLEKHTCVLDDDEGIRTVGNSKSPIPNGYIFITRFNEKYCINICKRVWDTRKKIYDVGGNDKYYYFDTCEEALNMIKSIIKMPLEAWLY